MLEGESEIERATARPCRLLGRSYIRLTFHVTMMLMMLKVEATAAAAAATAVAVGGSPMYSKVFGFGY